MVTNPINKSKINTNNNWKIRQKFNERSAGTNTTNQENHEAQQQELRQQIQKQQEEHFQIMTQQQQTHQKQMNEIIQMIQNVRTMPEQESSPFVMTPTTTTTIKFPATTPQHFQNPFLEELEVYVQFFDERSKLMIAKASMGDNTRSWLHANGNQIKDLRWGKSKGKMQDHFVNLLSNN